MKLPFAASYEMGEVAVAWAVDRLVADRWAVIRLDQVPSVGGRGPRLFGDSAPVLPDTQITKYGRTGAVEVKAKTAATWGRAVQAWEHGIDRDAFDQYREYERQMPTFLLIVELGADRTRRDPYIARITDIRPHFQTDNHGCPMAYWPREQMTADWLTRLNRWAAPRKGRKENLRL